MPITEKQRHDLFTKLSDAVGGDSAGTLMELLPRSSGADVVTTSDLDRGLASLRDALRGDIYRAALTSVTVLTAVVGLLLAITHG